MKKTWIYLNLFLALSYIHHAHAQAEQIDRILLNSTEASYFDEVSKWYDQGTEVSFEDVKHGWSGRCFTKVDPNTPSNSILISIDENAAGPAFPAKKYLGLLFSSGNPANFFDNYDIEKDSEVTAKTLQESITKKQTQEVIIDNGTLTWTLDFEPNQRPDTKHFVRRYKDFIVIREDNLIEGNSLYSETLQRTISGVKKGPWSTCYYFKNLHQLN